MPASQHDGPPVLRSSWLQRLVGPVAFGAVILIARVRSLGRSLRADRDRVPRSLASQEVIVAFPGQAWRGARSELTLAVIDFVVQRMERWNVKAGYSSRLDGLSRSYLRLTMTPGAEDDVVRALNVVARRFGLPRGRFGLLVVRSPLILPATQPDPPGPIEFTARYHEAKTLVGATGTDAQGVTVLVVDIDRPDKRFLPADVAEQVEILEDSDAPVTDGHATLVTAIVADIARGAKIKTMSIGDGNGAGLWSLLEVLLGPQKADVIVASLSAKEAGNSKNGRSRDIVFESMLNSRKNQPSRPPLLFPTGNHDPNEAKAKIDTIAIPARFASVIAIGAVDPALGRSAGSRYGRKQGADPSAWWLAPGGSFDGGGASTEPLAQMGNSPQAGTSVANAIAGGLAAVAINKLSAHQPLPDPVFEDAMDALERRLLAAQGAEESLVLAETIRSRHAGAVTHKRLVAELDRLSHPNLIASHNPLEHGRGLLCLD